MYWPAKYIRGLTQKQARQRKRVATRRTKMSWKSSQAYNPFASDKGIRTRKSSYTARWKSKYPNASGLGDASRISGISRSLLKKSYNRGMAAWRTGHRPGATQEQWGYARMYSMLQCGKADKDLQTQIKKTRKGKQWFAKTCR